MNVSERESTPRVRRLRSVLAMVKSAPWPRSTVTGLAIGILSFWVICAVAGETIAPYDPFTVDYTQVLEPPSAVHFFGTDQVGRDVFSRVIVGARDILIVAPAAAILGTVLGVLIGLAVGYAGGWFDEIVSRLLEAWLALPWIVLAILALVALGSSKWTVVWVIAIVSAPSIARTVRSAVIEEKEQEYITSCIVRKENRAYILFVELLPNVLPVVLVEFVVRLGLVIFNVATLSFLGLGIQPPSPDWGLQVAEHYSLLSVAWWPTILPALAIASLVVSVNLVLDGVSRSSMLGND